MNLLESAKAFSGKKEVWTLDKIPVDIEMKEDTFTNKEGKEVKYFFVEINGYKYTITSKVLEAIQQVVNVRPETKFIKIQKTPKGEIYAVPLD